MRHGRRDPVGMYASPAGKSSEGEGERRKMLNASAISDSSSALMSCSLASLERRGLGAALPVAAGALRLGGYGSVSQGAEEDGEEGGEPSCERLGKTMSMMERRMGWSSRQA